MDGQEVGPLPVLGGEWPRSKTEAHTEVFLRTLVFILKLKNCMFICHKCSQGNTITDVWRMWTYADVLDDPSRRAGTLDIFLSSMWFKVHQPRDKWESLEPKYKYWRIYWYKSTNTDAFEAVSHPPLPSPLFFPWGISHVPSSLPPVPFLPSSQSSLADISARSVFALNFSSFFSKKEKRKDGSPPYYQGDTHADFSRLMSNMSGPIRKSAGN
jgi:hypothetical protein